MKWRSIYSLSPLCCSPYVASFVRMASQWLRSWTSDNVVRDCKLYIVAASSCQCICLYPRDSHPPWVRNIKYSLVLSSGASVIKWWPWLGLSMTDGGGSGRVLVVGHAPKQSWVCAYVRWFSLRVLDNIRCGGVSTCVAKDSLYFVAASLFYIV